MRSLSRRSFVRVSLTLSTAAAATTVLSACGYRQSATAAASCADPASMSPSETSLRQANHYVEQSADAAKTCAGCAFFTAGVDAAGCGSCQIYTGGPANPKGYCDSFAAKPRA